MNFYEPMLAKPASKPFSSNDWIFEVKWDGFRALAYVGSRFSLKSRNAYEFKYEFPEIAELRHLTKNVVLDGELIIMREGMPDFEAMQRRSRTRSQKEIERQVREHPATYVIFDILEKDGQPLVKLPLIERKAILKESVQEGNYCTIADFIEARGEDYFKLVSAQGLEGIVAKKKDSVYEQGQRSDCWLKIKNLRTADCVIFGYIKGQGASFASAIVGLYDKKERVYVANVEYGFSKETRKVLTEFFKEITIDEEGSIVWVKPVVVCEIIYQSVLSGCTLRFPRLHRIRLDKSPSECTLDQIAGIGKCANLSESQYDGSNLSGSAVFVDGGEKFL